MIFSKEQLDATITKVVGEIPDGHTHALVLDADNEGVKFAAVYTSVDGVWQARAAAEHDWNGDNKVGAQLKLSW